MNNEIIEELATYIDRENLASTSFLDKYAYIFSSVSAVSYVILQLSMGTNFPLGIQRTSFCSELEPLAPWVFTVSFGTASCILANGIVCLSSILHNTFGRLNTINVAIRRIKLIICTINFISASSIFLTYGINYGGLVRDQLGVYSVAAQWPEWLVCVPMLGFITISIVNKKLGLADICYVASIFAMITFGYLQTLAPSKWWCGFCFWLSWTAFAAVPACFHFVTTSHNLTSSLNSDVTLSHEDATLEQRIIAKQQVYREILHRRLMVIFPIFPLIYVGAFMGWFDHNCTVAAYILAGVFGKLFFTATVEDCYVDLQIEQSLIVVSELKMNATRRDFLRYIFHEMHIPLNAMTMGLNLISEHSENQSASNHIHDDVNESLGIMQGALKQIDGFMSSVLALHRIKERELYIEEGIVDLRTVVASLKQAMKEFLHEKQSEIIDNVAPDVPSCVRGDCKCIYGALDALLTNFIGHLYHGSSMFLTINKTTPTSTDRVSNSTPRSVVESSSSSTRYRTVAVTSRARPAAVHEPPLDSGDSDDSSSSYSSSAPVNIVIRIRGRTTVSHSHLWNQFQASNVMGHNKGQLRTESTSASETQKSKIFTNTGLGFVLAKELVKIYNGSIAIGTPIDAMSVVAGYAVEIIVNLTLWEVNSVSTPVCAASSPVNQMKTAQYINEQPVIQSMPLISDGLVLDRKQHDDGASHPSSASIHISPPKQLSTAALLSLATTNPLLDQHSGTLMTINIPHESSAVTFLATAVKDACSKKQLKVLVVDDE